MTEHVIEKAQQSLPNIPLTVISQGAEALVFCTDVHPYVNDPYLQKAGKYVIKYRPSKAYRHPKVDSSITRSRTIGEVKFMYKLNKLRIKSPKVILADYNNGIIWMGYVGNSLPNGEISSFKNWLWYLEKSNQDCTSSEVEKMCFKVGQLIGKLHLNDMIHGDLTSSNILLDDNEPTLIDFGLSSYSGLAEERAVDLYVLERAITSTHSVYAKEYNQWLLEGYEDIHKHKEFGKQGHKKLVEVLRKLDDVRLRGRKRSMLG